jgi:hypothetical protein
VASSDRCFRRPVFISLRSRLRAPFVAMQGCASSTAVAFAVDYSRAGSEASDLCNGGVGPVAEMNDMSGKGVETGNGMNISRVPKLCPRYAFWTLLAYVATRKISNLRYLNRAKKTDPPSRHQDKLNKMNRLQRPKPLNPRGFFMLEKCR